MAGADTFCERICMDINSARSPVQKWTARCVDVHGPQLRVLVVDDNKSAANAMVAYLTSENISCAAAYGGVDAIATATAWNPHVILMDISMPDCNGFEASLALRHDSRTGHIAIVAFTALDESEVRRHLSDSEFDGYCQKGQSPTKLLELITTFPC